MPRKATEKYSCKYCNTQIPYGDVCGSCNQKLKLIRKVQNIVREIKRLAKEETNDNG